MVKFAICYVYGEGVVKLLFPLYLFELERLQSCSLYVALANPVQMTV